jgi:hypothetical protein
LVIALRLRFSIPVCRYAARPPPPKSWAQTEIRRRQLNELGDDISPIDGLKAFALLAPTLESLTILRGRIIEQRGAEACDVTPAQAARPKIEETLELMRSRFNDIKKPKAT